MGRERITGAVLLHNINSTDAAWNEWWVFLYENKYSLAHVCDNWQSFVKEKYNNKIYTCERCGERFSRDLFDLQLGKTIAVFSGNLDIRLRHQALDRMSELLRSPHRGRFQ